MTQKLNFEGSGEDSKAGLDAVLGGRLLWWGCWRGMSEEMMGSATSGGPLAVTFSVGLMS